MADYRRQIQLLGSQLCTVKGRVTVLENTSGALITQYIKDITNLTVVGNDLNITFTDQDDVVQVLTTTLPGSGSSFIPNIVVDNYNDLLLETGQSLFEFAEVRNSQGTSWLPGSLGGTYRAAGLYYWNGTSWIHDNDAILQGLQSVVDVNSSQQTDIDLNTAKVTNVTTDLSVGTVTITTVDVNSSDGTNATLETASSTRAGLLTGAKFDEIVANTAKTGVTTEISNLSEDTTPSLGGELDCGANSIGGTVQTATGDGTTTIDWGAGNMFNFKFGAFNETFTFTAPTKPGTFILKLVQDGTGSRTATFPATVKWIDGTAPTLTTTATTGTDILTFYYDGTNYFAVEAINFS